MRWWDTLVSKWHDCDLKLRDYDPSSERSRLQKTCRNEVPGKETLYNDPSHTPKVMKKPAARGPSGTYMRLKAFFTGPQTNDGDLKPSGYSIDP
jgi:hypothetical protein